jgi:3-oxoacyl-[acyl-carrier protein] reductase
MIIVTGASRGLGRAICERLIRLDHEVLGVARDVSALAFPAMACDVSSYDEVKRVAQSIKATGGRVAGLINVAGVAAMNLALTTPPQVTKHLIEVNLMGTIFCCQQFAPLLIRNKAGSIINFSTIAVALGLKGESIYAASKAGIEGFSRAFAREMADFSINVNCIAPGPIATDLLQGVTPKQVANIVTRQIIQKQFTADDVCDLVELLLSPLSGAISGQVLHVGGA